MPGLVFRDRDAWQSAQVACAACYCPPFCGEQSGDGIRLAAAVFKQ